jgi:hypothetical protein
LFDRSETDLLLVRLGLLVRPVIIVDLSSRI